MSQPQRISDQIDGSKILNFSLIEQHGGNSIHENIRQNALAALKPHLPVSLPLYRRLQFGRFFEATTLLTNLRLDSTGGPSQIPKEEPWLIAFVDRSCRPETEVWLYSSWESLPTSSNLAPGGIEEHLILSLVKAMAALPTPTSIHQDILDAKAANNDKDSAGLSRDDYAAHMLSPIIMLWGAIHQATVPLLERLGVAGGEKFKTAATPNLMFTWDVDAVPPEKELPEGLRWGKLRPEHFALVRSRTQIPRQDRTLAILPNLAIFPTTASSPDPDPIAWTFVGLDASLTTLHVEPAYRGRGLAKALTIKLFSEKMGVFWEQEGSGDGSTTRWAQGYVIRGNAQSEGMCRSIGGKSEWDVYWVRVDMEGI